MKLISLKEVRAICPPKTEVLLKKDKIHGSYALHFDVPIKKVLPEAEFEQLKAKLKALFGGDTIQEIYTEETGCQWIIYFKKGTIKFK